MFVKTIVSASFPPKKQQVWVPLKKLYSRAFLIPRPIAQFIATSWPDSVLQTALILVFSNVPLFIPVETPGSKMNKLLDR